MRVRVDGVAQSDIPQFLMGSHQCMSLGHAYQLTMSLAPHTMYVHILAQVLTKYR
jgi:hypothetical protein